MASSASAAEAWRAATPGAAYPIQAYPMPMPGQAPTFVQEPQAAYSALPVTGHGSAGEVQMCMGSAYAPAGNAMAARATFSSFPKEAYALPATGYGPPEDINPRMGSAYAVPAAMMNYQGAHAPVQQEPPSMALHYQYEEDPHIQRVQAGEPLPAQSSESVVSSAGSKGASRKKGRRGRKLCCC
eukprot:TRINITY_DN43378_c0_g1_i1.p1 TRINITY_DN43378_c0_g1~~TRINITY_DN43378_c0_g1_i1.p1  ORF type:complete len:195 (-),score=23.48 TRINITY_DN43378_c0_g1_i1:20-571(-)